MSEITREEALAHFGVKGMKWGVRKAENREIRRARKVARKENFNITTQSVRTAVSKGETRKSNKETLAQMKASRLMNPDQITARRMTRGEKFIIGYGLATDVAKIAMNPKEKINYVSPAITGLSLARNQQQINKLKKAQGLK